MREQMQQSVINALAQAQNPALLCSFGKDSLLLLDLALNAGYDGPVYHLGEVSKFGQQVILDRGLTVYSWPTANRYLVPDGEGLAQVDEFVLGATLVPVVSPVTLGGKCDHGEYQSFRRAFRYPHDVTLTGYKRGEISKAVGKSFPAEIDIGATKLVSPLYEFSDEEVIDELGFTPPDDNAVEYCELCLRTIELTDWNRDAALARFRSRFNFH